MRVALQPFQEDVLIILDTISDTHPFYIQQYQKIEGQNLSAFSDMDVASCKQALKHFSKVYWR